MSKIKKATYKELMSYVSYLENKLNFNVSVLSKTMDHYIKFNKDDKKFMKYLEKVVPDNEKDIKKDI